MCRYPARIVLVFLCCALLFAVSRAAENDIVRVRVESLDALIADVGRLSGAVGAPMDREMILGAGLQQLGIQQTDWIDGKRPIVVVFPLQGMTLGPAGIVGAVPVTDAGPALNSLESMFKTHAVDGDLHTFSNEAGTPVVAVARDGYLLVGGSGDLLQTFDLPGALARGSLPPGNLALDIYLEPVAPLALGGLEQGRQIFMQNLETAAADAEEKQAEDEAAPSGDEPDPVDEPEAEYVAGDESPQPFDPAAISGIMDLYFDVLKDTINNVAHIQLSVEVSPGHAIVHERLLPRGGSTLAELVAAQKGGFPEIARLIDPEGAVYALAGRVEITPRAREAVLGYSGRYFSAIEGLFSAMGEDALPFSKGLGAMIARAEPLIGNWLDCARGDFAGAFRFDAEAGMSLQQVMGAADAEACRTLLDLSAELWQGVDDEAGAEPLVSVTRDALIHQGVSAQKQEFRMELPDTEETREAMEMIRSMWGGEAIVSYTGMADDVLLTASGPGAETGFKNLVDRIKDKSAGGGLTAESFAPFGAGPGLAGWCDVGALVQFISDFVPEGEGDDLEIFDEMPQGAGRLVFGGRFDATALNMDLAVPIEFLSFVGEAVRAEEEASAEEEAAAEEAQARAEDPDHGHAEGHDQD